jgi:hypothetical protein
VPPKLNRSSQLTALGICLANRGDSRFVNEEHGANVSVQDVPGKDFRRM